MNFKSFLLVLGSIFLGILILLNLNTTIFVYSDALKYEDSVFKVDKYLNEGFDNKDNFLKKESLNLKIKSNDSKNSKLTRFVSRKNLVLDISSELSTYYSCEEAIILNIDLRGGLVNHGGHYNYGWYVFDSNNSFALKKSNYQDLKKISTSQDLKINARSVGSGSFNIKLIVKELETGIVIEHVFEEPIFVEACLANPVCLGDVENGSGNYTFDPIVICNGERFNDVRNNVDKYYLFR